MKLTMEGLNPNQICARTDIPVAQIMYFLEKKDFKEGMKKIEKSVIEETFKDKIPLLKKIVGCSLHLTSEFLMRMCEDEDFKASQLKSLSDVRELSKLAVDLNTLQRLELGQSTQNLEVVSHSYQQTKVIIDDLRKKDPVFEYPELPPSEPEQ